MKAMSRIFVFTGAAASAVMMALFFLGYLNDSPSQILARKVVTAAAFILIGVGFMLHKDKSWKVLGVLAVLANILVIIFWVSMRDFM